MSDPPHDGAELDQLRAFEAIARLGTVGAAADELGRTQPAISARLGALEEAWRTRLFLRRPRGMELTPEGHRLLVPARDLLESASALDRAAGLPLAREAAVRLGSGDALGRDLVPRVLRRLLAERPGTSVRVREGSGRRLAEDLRAGEIDVALLPVEAAAGGGLERRPLVTSPVDVLLPPGGARGRRALRPAHLDGEPLVLLLPGSSFRQRVERSWEEEGSSLAVAVEVGSYSLVRRFVAAGLGAAPVPRVAFPGEAEDDVRRVRLDGVQPVSWDVATRAGAPLPSATSLFIDLLQDESGRIGCRAGVARGSGRGKG